MKDIVCRQQVELIERNLDLETDRLGVIEILLYKKSLNTLNTRMSKTEKQVHLLNTIIDRHSNEVLNTSC